MPAEEAFAYATLGVADAGDGVLVVTLDRPEVLNAINTQMGLDLLDLWTRLAAEPALARCVVLTGAGERAFCAGGDLKERNGMSDSTWRAQHEIFERGFLALVGCPVPVIAAVNGHAFGGGLETALACDFIYAERGARLALTEVRLGIMPGGGGTQTLTRAAGERRAKEIILSARPFSAEDALGWGIVNRLCEPGEALADALGTARAIAGNAPLSVAAAKQAIQRGPGMDLAGAYGLDIEAYDRLVVSEDRREGVQAFNEQRAPAFRGR